MNNTNKNDIEEILKSKMSGLSSSIDCFDRISAKAFDNTDNSYENGETVSDLENITGRKNRMSLLRWCASAAAALVIFSILPRITSREHSLSDMAADSTGFRCIMDEIHSEIATNTYVSYDLPLSYYSQNALMVTPLYGCPFSAENCEGIKVKIYIRTVNDAPTNQIYAVEYKGCYTDENIIAAAETSADISQEDIDSLGIPSQITNVKKIDDITVASLFCNDSRDSFISPEGDAVNLASLQYPSYYKTTTSFFPMYSFILYGSDLNNDEYFYDIKNLCRNKNELKNINSWKRSVYTDGCSAAPASSESKYTKKDIFSKAPLFSENEFAFISINNDINNTVTDYEPVKYTLIRLDDSVAADYGSLSLPVCLSTVKIYVPSDPIENNIRLRVLLSGNNPCSNRIYNASSIFFNEFFYLARISFIDEQACLMKEKMYSEKADPKKLKIYTEKYDSLVKLSENFTQLLNNSLLLYSKANDNSIDVPYDIENAKKIIDNALKDSTH